MLAVLSESHRALIKFKSCNNKVESRGAEKKTISAKTKRLNRTDFALTLPNKQVFYLQVLI